MDYLEKKSCNLLQRLKEIQRNQCSLHIDEQIATWVRGQRPRPPQAEQPIVVTATIQTPATTTTSSTTTQSPLSLSPIILPLIEENPATSPIKSEPPAETTTTKFTNLTATPIKTEPSETTLTTATTIIEPQPAATITPPSGPEAKVAIVEATIVATTTPSPSPATTITATEVLPLKQDKCFDDQTIGCFLSNIKHLESFDSDATESTSSNDSYDELEGFSHEEIPPKRSNRALANTNNINNCFTNINNASSSSLSLSQQHHQSMHQRRVSNAVAINSDLSDLKKKAIWKWANERSRLASRWTWLQAQIADLEFRIRGQNDATMHARAYRTPPLPPISPENSCSRTTPISKDFRRRRLIKASQILSDSTKKLVKFSHVPCICGSLPQTVAPCLSCNGRYNYLRQTEGENMPVSERISLLDPCCHPVLSFPDDLTLGSQLSYLLKQENINRKPAKGRPGRKKGSTAANLAAAAAAAAAAAVANGGSYKPGRKGKYHHGMVGRPPKHPTQTMIASNRLRRKYKHSNNTNNHDSNDWISSSNRRNKRVRRASSMNDSSMCSESSNRYPPNHYSNNSAQNVTRRRRSEQSAYDIDNIVIPFSIAATTRVEILEYKEIMTPSWRVWENGTSQAETIDEDVEDTSDEVYISRHSKGESEEKKRFSLKPPKNTATTTPAPTTPNTTNTNATTGWFKCLQSSSSGTEIL